jgi:hypothetical protein
MLKFLIIVALVVAAIQYLPMEFLIVIGLSPVGFAVGLPIARGLEAIIDSRY